MSEAMLRVGGVTVPVAIAGGWLGEYFDADRNRVSSKPYAYPAYDEYNCGSSPDRLNDGDFLAPGLLNVAVGIRTFYALQACRDQLDAGLQAIHDDPPLEDVTSEAKIAELVGPLYTVLDSSPRPHGTKATLLSKVLHASGRTSWSCTTSGYTAATSRYRVRLSRKTRRGRGART